MTDDSSELSNIVANSTALAEQEVGKMDNSTINHTLPSESASDPAFPKFTTLTTSMVTRMTAIDISNGDWFILPIWEGTDVTAAGVVSDSTFAYSNTIPMNYIAGQYRYIC